MQEQGSGIEKSELNQMSAVKHVIAVMSGKGGVGKSLVTGVLAAMIQKEGYKVGILDADVTGPSIPRMFGVKERPEQTEFGLIAPPSTIGIRIMSLNLLLEHEDDPVIWRGPIMANLIKQFWTDVVWGDLDYLLVDLPPGTGDAPLTVMQSLPLDGVVVVSSPQDLVLMVVGKAVKMARAMSIPILGLVENMSGVTCPKCGEFHEVFGPRQGETAAKEFGVPFLGSIPLDPNLAALCDQGQVEHYESSVFRKMAQDIFEAMEP
ncbi:MAG: Mrp/NBP35 family ATP-binding protein [Limnochordia bacterium]|nr:Mrp/NBP35 family ATP-binding protein [Limnochordia bacterium]